MIVGKKLLDRDLPTCQSRISDFILFCFKNSARNDLILGTV